MAENTKIEWATHTFNPWIGCSKVSPACDHCYAEALMDHRHHRVSWGLSRSRTAPSTWKQPLKWNRDAQISGEYTTVFRLSLGDIWDTDVPPEWRKDLFALIEATPHLTWLLLSKRIGNAFKMCVDNGHSILPANAALGATLVNQEEWDRDIKKLKTAGNTLCAKFTFASVEPMLSPIDTRGAMPDWVICGGESGDEARPMHPDWARSLRDQCAAAGVPFLFKQWGEYAPGDPSSPSSLRSGWTTLSGKLPVKPFHELYPEHGAAFVDRVGKKAAGRILDGVTHDGYPKVVA